MPMKILNARDDIPRAGANRQSAILAIANALWMINHVEGLAAPTLAPSPSATAPVLVWDGFKYAGVSGTWDFAAAVAAEQLTDVPPFRQMRYMLLLDKDGNTAIWPAVPTELNEPQRWAPNPLEAFANALNSGTGYACAGVLVVVNDTELPWTPGTAFPTGGTSNAFTIDGIDGQQIFAAARSDAAEPLLMNF